MKLFGSRKKSREQGTLQIREVGYGPRLGGIEVAVIAVSSEEGIIDSRALTHSKAEAKKFFDEWLERERLSECSKEALRGAIAHLENDLQAFLISDEAVSEPRRTSNEELMDTVRFLSGE